MLNTFGKFLLADQAVVNQKFSEQISYTPWLEFECSQIITSDVTEWNYVVVINTIKLSKKVLTHLSSMFDKYILWRNQGVNK